MLSRKINQAISLSELYLNLVLLVFTISTRNKYIGVVHLTLMSKYIPEFIFKKISSTLDLEIGKRPVGATDCNFINSGGIATSSGIISGHVLEISSFTFFLLYTFTAGNKQISDNERSILIILFTQILLMCNARVSLNCHTVFQVVFGFLFGAIWGFVVFTIVEKIVSNNPGVEQDKQRALAIINN